MPVKQKVIKVVQEIGLAMIVGLSLLYAIFRQRVSEKFIKLPLLDFPIFVGEIVLGFCFLLFALKLFLEYRSGHFRINWYGWGIVAYGIWIVTMALAGYSKIGAFAFRTSALFYYALFAVMAFHFYRREFFNQRIVLILILGMLAFTAQDAITLYCQVPFFLVFLFLLFSIDDKRIRMGGLVLLMLIVFLRFSWETSVHRSHIAGILGTLVFLFIFGLRYINKNNLFGKRLLVGFFIAAILGMYVFLDNDVRRSFALQAIVEEYKYFNNYIQKNKHLFIFRDVPPRLYQDDDVKYNRRPLTEEERAKRNDPFPDLAMVWPGGVEERPRPQNVSRFEGEPAADQKKSGALSWFIPKQQGRNILQSRNQILFRIFIWRDMLEDMKADPYSFIKGVGFHKPQRAHSIEILGWGRQEWGSDGWITMHNSFLNMIYRGGVIGWALLGTIVILTVQMTKDFGRRRILSGGLLVAGLVYWIVISNFLVYLEVPHTAIPFWGFLGVVCAFWRDCIKERPSL